MSRKRNSEIKSHTKSFDGSADSIIQNKSKSQIKMFLFRLIAQNLVLIHKGSMVAKFKSTLFISLMASPFGFVELFSEWISENGGYLFFVLLAIAIDHLMGSAVHLFIKKDFSIKKNKAQRQLEIKAYKKHQVSLYIFLM